MFMLIILIIKILGIGVIISIGVTIISAIVKVFGYLPTGSVTAVKQTIKYYDQKNKK